jgi:hypothetical protein
VKITRSSAAENYPSEVNLKNIKYIDKISESYLGKQDIGNAYTSMRENFHPTYGVTYSEPCNEEDLKVPSQQQPGHKLITQSERKLSGKINGPKDPNLKIQGGDYSDSITGKRMRRRDYERNNISLDNIRPFYQVSSMHSFENPNSITLIEQPKQNKTQLQKLQRIVSHSLLVNEQVETPEESDQKSSIGFKPLYSRNRVRLPKLREKFTLHLTTQGPKMINQSYVPKNPYVEEVQEITDETFETDFPNKSTKDLYSSQQTPLENYYTNLSKNPKYSIRKWKLKKLKLDPLKCMVSK